ncbi:MAG: MarR family transcriptional regulator [Microbacterium sp.]|nr:MarR family transcriptional regulator [Microbacterium sp.]
MPRSVVRHEGEHLYARPPASPDGRRLSDALLQLRRSEQLQAERAVRASGLSGVDLTALRYLVQGERDGRDLGPKDVIVMLNTSSATVTNVIERLVGRGYVIRVQHPTDRRAHYLKPTPDAIRCVEESYGEHHATLVAVIDDLDDGDARVAAEIVERLVDSLDDLVARDSSA